MKVALVTSWGERCGIAGYAKNLCASSSPGVEFKIIARPFEKNQILAESVGCDVVHFNYEPGLMAVVTTETIREIRATGKKVLLTLHTSHGGDNRTDFTKEFNRVVVHEKTEDEFTYIPHGIVDKHLDRKMNLKFRETFDKKVGTVGFPFPWKGFTQVVQAAKLMGIGAIVICPESPHANAQMMKEHLLHEYDRVEVVTQWLSDEDTIAILSNCWATMFAYHGGNYGISGACRLGISTGLPVILTRSCRQFRDLFDYEDEIYFADQPTPNLLANELDKAISSIAKRPSRVLKDMGWSNCANKYEQVYRELFS